MDEHEQKRMQSAELGPDSMMEPRTGQKKAGCPVHTKGSMLNPVSFYEIAAGRAELWIELEGQQYRLSMTRQGKLILTK